MRVKDIPEPSSKMKQESSEWFHSDLMVAAMQ